MMYGMPWIAGSVVLPHGCPLRMKYDGATYRAEIMHGKWFVGGALYASPSAAAMAATGKSLDGWLYWQAVLPLSDEWVSINTLRKAAEVPT
jgi:hypothetical protein